MARPKLEIDPKTIIGFARLGATNVEIADHFNCDEGTIRKRFSDILTKERASRKIKLREMQWKLAEKGNLGMLIWLGKQELGQVEKIDQNQNLHTNGKPLYPVMSREEARAKLEQLRGNNGKDGKRSKEDSESND